MPGDNVQIQCPKSLRWSTTGTISKAVYHEGATIPSSYEILLETGDLMLKIANSFVLGRFRQGKTSNVAFMKGMLTRSPKGGGMLTEQYVTRLLTSFMKRHYLTRLF